MESSGLTSTSGAAGPYAELKSEVGESRQLQTTGQSGTQYQVDVQVRWDDIPNGDIRVLGGIDDGGWRAFAPLTEDFILGPEWKAVGEERQPATSDNKEKSMPYFVSFQITSMRLVRRRKAPILGSSPICV